MDDVCDTTLGGITIHNAGVWDDRIYYHSNADDPISPFPTSTALGDVDRPPIALPDGSNFALSIEGWIYIATAGSYTFGVDSNDASDFVLYDSDPATPLASANKYGAGGCSATYEAGWALHNSGTVTLTAGWKQFRARTYNLGWGHGFGIGWLTPDAPSTWAPIPRTVLTAGAIDGYPRMGKFYEGRHWVFRDITAWASKSGQAEDFEIGSNDGDAMELDLDTQRVDLIQAVEIVKGGLEIFTSGGILNLDSGGQGVMTPENRRQEEEIAFGSAFIQPVKIGNSIFFVGKDRKEIWEMKYSQQRESQAADDITVLAQHYFTNKIRKIVCQTKARTTYQDVRIDLLWALTEGGELYAMTYDEVNKVYAWHPHLIENGDVQAICATVGIEGEELYIAVDRDETARSIEVLNPDLCLDCAITDANTKTPVAKHLASQSIAVRWGTSADSITGWENQTLDADGVGTPLDLTATPAYLEIGLPYDWKAVTMPLEKGYSSGSTTKGKDKRWMEVGIEFKDSGGSITLEKLGGRYTYPLLTDETTLFSGEKAVTLAGYDREAVLELAGSDPMPACILSIRASVAIV
jgi:hypothetical protein